jgi:hypothetical protein
MRLRTKERNTQLRSLFCKLMRVGIMALFATTFLFGIVTVSVPSQHIAHASDNGQVIGFGCGGDQLWDAYVYGTNQDNNYAAWHQNVGGAASFVTSSWWWKGNLHIDVWDSSYNGGTWLHRDYWIPTVWPENRVYGLSC